MQEVKRLDNGSTLLYSKKEGYFTYLKFHFNVGSNDEPENLRGGAHLLEHMTFNGTQKYPRGRVEEIIEGCGGDINACTSEYYTRYYGNVIVNDTKKLVDVLSDMCFAPTLKEEDFATEKNIVIQELHDREDDVWNYLFDKYFYRCFGSFPTIGSEDSINQMAYNDFVDFHKKYYNFNNLIISIVTPLEIDEVTEMIQSSLSEYKFDNMFKNENRYEITNTQHDIKDVMENLDQTKLLSGFIIPRGYSDFAGLYTQILGGGMTSKLFKNLREEKKLCYNVFSYTQNLGDVDYIGIGISFNDIGKYDEILQNCADEINNMKNVSEAEFDGAKNTLFSNLCKVDENRPQFANALITRHKNNMPLSTDERISQLKKITIDDFNSFVENHCINQQMYTYLLYDDKTN